jgi:hypothetical protein
MRDSKTENYLNRGNWSFTYLPRVEFREIDLRASDENPARLNRRLDDDRAWQYGYDMANGCEFPALVLLNLAAPYGSYKYIVATGMHRIRGAETIDRSWFDAYVVIEPDEYRRQVLSRQINAIEGRGMTVQEVIAQVLVLKDQYPGKSIKDLAKEWSLREPMLANAYSERRAHIRARNFNFDFTRLPQKSTLALGSIHSDVVFQKAAELATTLSCVQSGEIKDMAQEIRQARDEKTQLAVVERFREAAEGRMARAKAKHGRITPGAINRIISDCKRLNNQIEKPYDQMHVAALEDRPRAMLMIEGLMENLKRLLAEIERVNRMTRNPVVRADRASNAPPQASL